MLFIIYNVLLYTYFIINLPMYVFKFFTTEKYRKGLINRLGFGPIIRKKAILIHAVSVGEVLALLPMLEALKQEYADFEIILSTTTITGNRIANAKAAHLCKIVFFPLDFYGSVKRFLKRINLVFVILVETEIWPNFLCYLKKHNIPVVVVNGRISNRSHKRYAIARGLFKYICSDIRGWGVQSELDRERLMSLGIADSRIVVTGSLKIDTIMRQIPNREQIESIEKIWGKDSQLKIITAGSTHRGEEHILLDIFKELKTRYNKLTLILAPRHPERFSEVKELVENYSLKYKIRSEWKNDDLLSGYDVVIIDNLGELLTFYILSDIVFIGKSLVKKGGQNLLEPAGLGKAVICGPFMQNFMEITDWLVQNNGIMQVKDAFELRKSIIDLLENPIKCETFGQTAHTLISRATGATKKSLELIHKVMG